MYFAMVLVVAAEYQFAGVNVCCVATGSQSEGSDHDNEWENQQIRKGVGGKGLGWQMGKGGDVASVNG